MSLTPFVVHCQRDLYDVYVGRPSIWGNPHPVSPKYCYRCDAEHSRESAILLFEEDVRSNPSLVAAVKSKLKGKVLGCWCAPNPCHGDVLAKIANDL